MLTVQGANQFRIASSGRGWTSDAFLEHIGSDR